MDVSIKFFHSLKIYLLAAGLIVVSATRAGSLDTIDIKKLYDRCLDFDESKTDSLCIYADLIDMESRSHGFDKGPVLSLRLKGICYEYRSDYNVALDYYLQSLDAARKLGNGRYIISAMNDVAMTYSYIGQPALAKQYFMQCAELALPIGELSTVITTLSNLGATYSQLQQYDSALVYLLRSVELGKPLGDSIDLSSNYNNIGNAYFNKRQYGKALQYFRINFIRHRINRELGSLWTDHLNLADVFLSTDNLDSSAYHADEALRLATLLKSKSKEADSYAMLSKYYSKKGNYKKAFEFSQLWYKLDTALVNGNTQAKIVELQERFNAKGREAQNRLLRVEVERQNDRNRNMMLFAVALGLIVLLTTIAFVIKRNSNRKLLANNSMILQQNEKLAKLNQEKNALIGIVSHDLGSPFASIQVWGQLLEGDSTALTPDHKKAVKRIMESANHGQDMIKNILDVEKMDSVRNKVVLEEFDIVGFVESIVQDFQPTAIQKQIDLIFNFDKAPVYFISDQQLIRRLVENLLSNAIKFSPKGKKVWIELIEKTDVIVMKVVDEGVGIENEEIPMVFNKYSKISSRPTNGEASTGMGLSIVKRIVEDLNGSIQCESELGKGTSFLITLEK